MKKVPYNKLVSFLLHPALIALPVSVAFILLIPDLFHRYTIELKSEHKIKKGSRIEYHDLNSDGTSEWFYVDFNDSISSAITVYNKAGIIDQWNIPDFRADIEKNVIVGDADGDLHLEIYPLLIRNDSLFLYAIDYREKSRFTMKNKFITMLEDAERQTYTFRSGHLTDLDSDGVKEIVIPLSAGFPLYPRRFFVYNLKKDKLIVSDDFGVSLGKIRYEDLNGDGIDELIAGTTASANYKDTSVFMNDHSAYIIALNNQLKFLFRPVQFQGDFTACNNFPYFENGIGYIATFIQQFGTDRRSNPQIQIRDIHGSLIKQISLDTNLRGLFCDVVNLRKSNGNNCLLMVIPEKGIHLLQENLQVRRTINLVSSAFSRGIVIDIDADGNDELILQSVQLDTYYIVSHDLQNVSTFTMSHGDGPLEVSLILNGSDPPFFSVTKGIFHYRFCYCLNTSYFWRIPFSIAVYLVVFLLLLIVRNLQYIQLRKKYEAEKKLGELQLLSLRNQMDPHFTFNVMNTIGSAILQKRNEESYDLLMKFSRLIRTTINSANVLSRPLKEELDFVKNYLDLQMIRHEELFIYNVHIDTDINTLQAVPKMILQTYVENSLKHGLVPRKKGGVIQIIVRKEEKGMRLTVEDNGVGRQQAKINGTVSTGVGLSIIGQYYALLNRENEHPITETFTDLFYEEGKAAGTRVEVFIPEGFGFPGKAHGK